MTIASMAEQMIFFAKPPIFECKPFEAWAGLRGGPFRPDMEITFEALDSGEWTDVLSDVGNLPMTAQPMQIRFQVLARVLRTISGVPIVTDEQLAEYMRTMAEMTASGDTPLRLHQDPEQPVTIPMSTRIRYLVQMIRKWPLHVTNEMFEAYTRERETFMQGLQEEVGKSSGTSQAESVGRSPSNQDSPPSSDSGMRVD